MYWKTKLTALVAATFALSFVLTACGDDAANTSPSDDNRVSEVTERLADGRTVVCLKYDDFREAGLSCDWARAK